MPKDPEQDSAEQPENDAEENEEDSPPKKAKTESEAPPAKSKRAERARERDRDDDEPRRSRKGKRKKAKRPLPRTEAEVDAPDVQTLWMLGALTAMVLIMWGSARFACNAHPDETRKPREIATSEVSMDPKGTAIELAQRWATRNFDGALELSAGKLTGEIQQEKAQCEANAQCTGEREALKNKVLTTGELLARQPAQATVRVTSINTAEGQKSYILELETDGKNWKAKTRLPPNAVPIQAPPTGLAPTPLAPMPAPSAAPAAKPSH
jgi:hypothetical protein